MPGNILTTTSTIMCTHGGQATLTTTNTRVTTGAQALLETDTHTVVGCPFSVGSKYSPCVRIEWSAGASSVSVGNTPVLIKSSIGTCYNAENVVQGLATVVNSQLRVMTR